VQKAGTGENNDSRRKGSRNSGETDRRPQYLQRINSGELQWKRDPSARDARSGWRPWSGRQYLRRTPTTRPCIFTSAAATMIGAMDEFAGCRRIFPPGSR